MDESIVQELEDQIKQASWSYTMGNEIMTDTQFSR